MSEYWKAWKLSRRHMNYIEPECKHIKVLWNQYGLTSMFEDDVLAEVVSHWLCLLYPKEFHTTAQDIEKQLLECLDEQGRLILSLLDLGTRVQLVNYGDVVLERLFDELPNYDEVSEDE